MEDEVQDDMDLLESGSSDSDDDYGPMVRTEGMELEEFDRNLPAAHSYLPNNLQPIPGRSVLEPGWTGRVLCWRHKSVVFPGETIPMVFVNTLDMDIMQHMIQGNRLFGLVFKEIQGLEGTHTYGVLCEVVEATPPVNTAGHHLFREPFSFKAKARQRFILKAKGDVLIRRIDSVEIKILPDVSLNDPLENVRFSSLGRHKNVPKTRMNELVRKADSMTTPWPQFVYDVFDVDRVVEKIREYFSKMAFANLPNDNLSLSYWVGTNLSVSNKDRLSLFCTNNIVLRLSMELYHIGQKSRVLCCVLCGTEVCEKSKVFAMSNEGIYSNFCNIGGYVHDIMTASEVTNLTLQGTPSTKFTWFPGYSWTIAVCTTCGSHVGWRFDACKVNLNPASFWGLGRRSLVHDTENNVFEDPMSENRNAAPTNATPTAE